MCGPPGQDLKGLAQLSFQGMVFRSPDNVEPSASAICTISSVCRSTSAMSVSGAIRSILITKFHGVP